MLELNELEQGLDDFIEGYKSTREAIKNYQLIGSKDESESFAAGGGAYIFFNFRKVRNYRKVMKERLNSDF